MGFGIRRFDPSFYACLEDLGFEPKQKKSHCVEGGLWNILTRKEEGRNFLSLSILWPFIYARSYVFPFTSLGTFGSNKRTGGPCSASTNEPSWIDVWWIAGLAPWIPRPSIPSLKYPKPHHLTFSPLIPPPSAVSFSCNGHADTVTLVTHIYACMNEVRKSL